LPPAPLPSCAVGARDPDAALAGSAARDPRLALHVVRIRELRRLTLWHLSQNLPDEVRKRKLRCVGAVSPNLRLFRLAAEVLHAIEAGVFHPNPGWQCKECPYRVRCWAWKDSPGPAERNYGAAIQVCPILSQVDRERRCGGPARALGGGSHGFEVKLQQTDDAPRDIMSATECTPVVLSLSGELLNHPQHRTRGAADARRPPARIDVMSDRDSQS